MINMFKKTVYTCFFLLFLTNSYCQTFLDKETLKQEAEFDIIRSRNVDFIEGLADTLLLKGKKYFFRRASIRLSLWHELLVKYLVLFKFLSQLGL